jgi:uncharacterized protein
VTAHFEPGAEVVVRYLVRERLWGAFPWTVVEDTPDRLKMTIAPGTRWMCPVGADAQTHIHLQASAAWTFEERDWNGWCVSIGFPGAAHAFESYGVGDDFLGWKINLEAPKRRTSIGFDTTDHYLDVRIDPDGSWRWDDEDEMDLAIELGIFTRREADAARREGEIALERLRRADTLFAELRTPPSALRPARIPEDWDSVPLG